MGSRPVFWPRLGDYFAELREAKGWSQHEVEHRAHRKGLRLSYQTVRGLEQGETKHPAPDVLKTIASLYGVPYPAIVARVTSEQYGLVVTAPDRSRRDTADKSDLTCHSVAVQSEPSKAGGGSREADAVRIRALEDRVEDLETYEIIVKHIRPLVDQIVDTIGAEGAAPQQGKTASGRRHRTTHR